MTAKSEALHAELFGPLRSAVAEAGKLALTKFRGELRSWNKSNASPVSEADLAVDSFLRERLTGLDSTIGWLSEETVDSPERLFSKRLWIVDPIDGTRSFIAGREDWAVCAALVEDGRPVAAAIELPATGESFAAIRGGGATKNGQKIFSSSVGEIGSATVAIPAKLNSLLNTLGSPAATPRIHSIAVRLSRVASGEIDAALASANAHDWDLAAADLLVHEAGGKMTDAGGRLPLYNLSSPVHGALVAAGNQLHPKIVSALAGSLK